MATATTVTSILPNSQTVLYFISIDAANPTPDTTVATSTIPTTTAPLSSSTSLQTGGSTSISITSISSSAISSFSQPSTNSSSVSSITQGLNTTSSGSTSAPASTRLPPSTKSSSNTGYVAAIAVLAVLLGIVLAALAFLCFRKRRNPKHARPLELVSDEPKVPAESGARVATLERQLHEREGQLRASQAALLQQGRSIGGDTLDDRQVNQRFAQVNKSIRDWVVGNFKTMSGNPSLAREVAPLLQNTQPKYQAMLEDPRKKYLVLRSLVAEILVRAFKSGELLGSPAYSELNSWILESGSAHDVSEWRTMTMALLDKSPAYRTERATSVQEISGRIDFMAADIAGLGASELRASQMHKIVNSVATLASDLAQQKSTYDLSMERGVFDSVSMEDALQDYSEDRLQGKPVQCVVFPAVKKWEDGIDRGSTRGRVISKAQVLT